MLLATAAAAAAIDHGGLAYEQHPLGRTSERENQHSQAKTKTVASNAASKQRKSKERELPQG